MTKSIIERFRGGQNGSDGAMGNGWLPKPTKLNAPGKPL